MRITLLIGFFVISDLFCAQQVKGRIVSDSAAVGNVLVININSQEKTYSDPYGQFIITANAGNEIRFVKEGYERKDVVIKNQNELIIVLRKPAIEIEEVEVRSRLSGNLAKDSKLFGESRKKTVLNSDLRKYFKAPSGAELLKAKPGEFIQPVGSGFSVGTIDNKWVMTDFVEWIRENLTDDYFFSLGLKFSEINPFLYFSLRTFDSKNILKYGYCSGDDAGRLRLHLENTFEKFKNRK